MGRRTVLWSIVVPAFLLAACSEPVRLEPDAALESSADGGVSAPRSPPDARPAAPPDAAADGRSPATGGAVDALVADAGRDAPGEPDSAPRDGSPGLDGPARDAAGDPAATQRACSSGEARCAAGDVPETCLNGRWVRGTACRYVCVAGTCTGACSPGSKQCAGNTPQTCSGDGQWVSGAACPHACAAGTCTGECVPGTKQCRDGAPATCSPGGQWVIGPRCPFLCSAGECAGSCSPGDKRCSANVPQSCNGSGQWVSGSPCAYVCDAGACTGVCVPGRTRCSGTQHETCDPTGQWTSTPGDCTPPTILSVSPADGATGVRSSAKIVVTFSEPMNRAATEGAWASADLPASAVAFAWDATGSILSVSPVSPLEYASGADWTIAARRYEFSVGAGAQDAAGSPLATPRTSRFWTLRRITRDQRTVAQATGFASSTGYSVSAAGSPKLVTGTDGSGGSWRAFLTFDLSDIPTDVAEIESATIKVFQSEVIGDQFAYGPLEVAQVRFGTFDPSVFGQSPLRRLGPLSTSTALGWKMRDVTDAVRDDLAARASAGNRSQFRLSFDPAGGEYVGNAHYDSSTGDHPPELGLTVLRP